MISKGTKTFYALTGAGAYTGGLLPHHCARLWKAYCVPCMLYGVVVYKLTQVMRNKLDRAQHQLFKKILGLPNSAADEVVYLLTGLIPPSMQADQETLLVIGQIVNLPHSRYEVRTLLHALTQNTPMLRKWEDTLRRYQLPDLSSLIRNPVLYKTWKSTTKHTINSALQERTQEATTTKSSLSLFNKKVYAACDLYPSANTSKLLRQANIIRAQLVTQTYLTQSRLCKLKKTTNSNCQLCKEEGEDTVHFIAKCPIYRNHRQALLEDLRRQGTSAETLLLLQGDPLLLTEAVLLPRTITPNSQQKDSIITMTLAFL